MAEPRQFIDVWIIDSNTVYREVPFTVVCDWVQQGRLLEGDCVRRSGTPTGNVLATSRHSRRSCRNRSRHAPTDQAEALEAVEFEFGWKEKHAEHEDDEVDMIPLIDVSLVLLIFFMLTASGVGAASLVKLAGVKSPPVSDTKGICINMVLETKGDQANDRLLPGRGRQTVAAS